MTAVARLAPVCPCSVQGGFCCRSEYEIDFALDVYVDHNTHCECCRLAVPGRDDPELPVREEGDVKNSWAPSK